MKTTVVLVLLAALFLVPAALANSIDYDTGNFVAGTMTGRFLSGSHIDIGIVGSLDTIDLQTGALLRTTAGCAPGAMCFSFVGGLVKVAGSNGTIFVDSIAGGISIAANGTASVIATLMPKTGVVSGTASASFTFSGRTVTAGSENVAINTTAVVPEPATLLLFGSGLVGVAGMKFRKRLLQVHG